MGASASSSSSAAPINMHHDASAAQASQSAVARSGSYRQPPSSGMIGTGSSGAPPPQAAGDAVSANAPPSAGTARGGCTSGARDSGAHLLLNRPEPLESRQQTYTLSYNTTGASGSRSARLGPSGADDNSSPALAEGDSKTPAMFAPNRNDGDHTAQAHPSNSNGLCLNPASELNSRLDTQVEIKVYPCNNSSHGNNGGRKKCTQFIVKPEVREIWP
jgi:hypothetical protein